MKQRLIKQILFSVGFLWCIMLSSAGFGQYRFTKFQNSNSSPQMSDFEKPLDIDYNHTYLTLNSDISLNSSGLSNDFINQFYLGHFLGYQLKKENLDRLQPEKNLLGYKWVTQLQLNFTSKKRGFSYYAAFENHNYYELSFDKNLYQLVFFGNRELAGEEASLDKQSFTILKFQQIKAGIVKTWCKKSKVDVLTAGLGINNGQSLLSYEIPKATFFTQSDAEYISLDMQMNMHRSDTLSSRFGAENGLGLCLDLSFYHRDAHNSFEIKMENLGFISWNKQSQYFSKDTLVDFDGVEIANIFDINSETINGLSQDSITNEFSFSKETGRFTKMIPMRGSINYTRYVWKNRLALSLSLINYHFSQCKPLIRFEPTYQINIKRSLLCIIPSVEYGGYGRFNYGLGISANISGKFFIEARTNYLNGYFDLKHTAGLGAYVSIIKTL